MKGLGAHRVQEDVDFTVAGQPDSLAHMLARLAEGLGGLQHDPAHSDRQIERVTRAGADLAADPQ